MSVPSGRNNPMGYAPWSPRADTMRVLSAVNVVLDEYADQLPLTVRQMFYALVAREVIAKDELAYARLGYVLGRARRARMLPFHTLRDDGEVTIPDATFDSVAGFWDDAVRRADDYRRDRQAGQTFRIELWCEAAGMVPQLHRVAREYSVPVYSSGGFLSLTSVKRIADRAVERTRPTLLLHVGDHDPSGVSIFDRLAKDAAAFVEADRIVGTSRIEAVRLALTEDQIDAFGLPTVPAKSSDSRIKSWKGGTCQLEALPPDVLAVLVQDGIEAVTDVDRLDRIVAAEEDDRVQLRRALPGGES